MPQAHWTTQRRLIQRRGDGPRGAPSCTVSDSPARWPNRRFMIIITDEAGSSVLIKMPANRVCAFGNHGTRRLLRLLFTILCNASPRARQRVVGPQRGITIQPCIVIRADSGFAVLGRKPRSGRSWKSASAVCQSIADVLAITQRLRR